MIKTLTQVGIEGTYLNITKAIYDKPTANLIVSGKASKSISIETRETETAYHGEGELLRYPDMG